MKAIFLKYKIYIGIGFIIFLFLFGVYQGAKIYKKEMLRQENNYLAAIQELKNDNKESQRVFEIKLSEVKQQFPELVNQIKEMNLKLKNVVSVDNINTETKTNINTIVRDTLIADTIPAKVAVYKDQWTDFKMVEMNNHIQASITTRDSLIIVLNRVKRTFGEWWRGEPKILNLNVKSLNPNNVITYKRSIQITK